MWHNRDLGLDPGLNSPERARESNISKTSEIPADFKSLSQQFGTQHVNVTSHTYCAALTRNL